MTGADGEVVVLPAGAFCLRKLRANVLTRAATGENRHRGTPSRITAQELDGVGNYRLARSGAAERCVLMSRHFLFPSLVLAVCIAACLAVPISAADIVVDPKAPAASDANPGSADKPLKTIGKALDIARPGDTILLAAADYPSVVISRTYEKPLTIRAAKDARPVMVGGVAIRQASGVRLSGLTFTWRPGTRPVGKPMTPFIEIASCTDVEISDCEIYDDPSLTTWLGWACSMGDSDGVTICDTKAHHFYFGFSAYRSKNVVFRNLDIQMWSYEDGIRVTECEGPILIEKCHITNSGIAGAKGGHVDGIQSVYWSRNVTIRNCWIHGLGQGIGAFGDGQTNRRANWRVEGCLIYDTYAPHACSIYGCDGVVLVNNTFPQNRPFTPGSTGVVIKNNIIGLPMTAQEDAIIDYNLMLSGSKVGEHDIVGDPKFVNAPLSVLRNDASKIAQTTRSKFFISGASGRLAVGDIVEIYNTDGSARDATPRKVTAVGSDWIEVDPPIPNEVDPVFKTIFIYKWPADARTLVPDYHLKADSPAVDSADGSVRRGRDMDGREPTDIATVANRGAGEVNYLDRGAFEYVPAGQGGRP